MCCFARDVSFYPHKNVLIYWQFCRIMWLDFWLFLCCLLPRDYTKTRYFPISHQTHAQICSLYIGLYIILFNCEVRSCIISVCWIERTIKQSCIPWPPNAARFHWSPPYEIMQLQTSIRSCEGNHYVVTVIDDSAENSAFLFNNPGAQGLSGVGEVTKETDDIQNGPAVLDTPSLHSRLLSSCPPAAT